MRKKISSATKDELIQVTGPLRDFLLRRICVSGGYWVLSSVVWYGLMISCWVDVGQHWRLRYTLANQAKQTILRCHLTLKLKRACFFRKKFPLFSGVFPEKAKSLSFNFKGLLSNFPRNCCGKSPENKISFRVMGVCFLISKLINISIISWP